MCFRPFAFIPWTPFPELSGIGHSVESFPSPLVFLWCGNDRETHPAQPADRGAAWLRGVCPTALRRAHVPAPPAAGTHAPSRLAPLPCSPTPLTHLFSKSSSTHLGKAADTDACRARVSMTCVCLSLALLHPDRDRWASHVPHLPCRVRSEDSDRCVTSPRPGARRQEGVGNRSTLEPLL